MTTYEIEIVIHSMNECEKVMVPKPLALEIPLYYILPVSINTDELISKDIDLVHSNFMLLSKKKTTGEKVTGGRAGTALSFKAVGVGAKKALFCDMV